MVERPAQQLAGDDDQGIQTSSIPEEDLARLRAWREARETRHITPVLQVPAPSERTRAGRRVRTAHSRLIEFFLVPDFLWALILAGPATFGLCHLLSLSLLSGLLLFAGLALALFVLLWLALINCNPYPAGTTVLDHYRSMSRALPTLALTHTSDLSQLELPLIFKPSLCSTNSSGVELVTSLEQARAYLAATVEEVVCAQPFHSGEEYTIMWERWPWRREGRVVAVYWRRKTHPAGEFHPLSGSDTPKDSVEARHLVTAALCRTVADMVERMPGVYCTRFDVRADSDAEMAAGEFWVLESNGTVGVTGGGQAYSIFLHWPKRMLIGLYNILTHPDASAHPRVLVRRMRRFMVLGGWDFRICDAF